MNPSLQLLHGMFPGSKAHASDASAATACNGRMAGTQGSWYSLHPSPSQLQMPFTLAVCLPISLDFDPLRLSSFFSIKP